MQQTAHHDGDAWVTSAKLREHFGNVCPNTILRWRKLGFPAPMKIHGRNYWRASELANWRRKQEASAR
jgi:hypothetical protein